MQAQRRKLQQSCIEGAVSCSNAQAEHKTRWQQLLEANRADLVSSTFDCRYRCRPRIFSCTRFIKSSRDTIQDAAMALLNVRTFISLHNACFSSPLSPPRLVSSHSSTRSCAMHERFCTGRRRLTYVWSVDTTVMHNFANLQIT